MTSREKSKKWGRFPGYTRGLAIHGNLAIVGLSKIRESSTFGGLPISERPEGLKCGIAIVDLSTKQLVSQFEFKSGVDEIFDVAGDSSRRQSRIARAERNPGWARSVVGRAIAEIVSTMMDNRYSFESVWPDPSTEICAEAVDFWVQENALSEGKAMERASQLLIACRDCDGNIAAVTTVVPSLVATLGLRCFYFRAFVGRKHRALGLKGSKLIYQLIRGVLR